MRMEWGEELWVATVDVEKAFDRVHHSALFDAMPCSALLCIAYPLGIIALLDIRLYEQRGDLRHGKGWEGGVGRQI